MALTAQVLALQSARAACVSAIFRLADGAVWVKLAAELKGRINVAEVNCEASGSRSICSQQGIKGFPTLLLFDGVDKAEYSGARSVPLMSKWALEAVEASGLQPADASSFQAAVKAQPVVFLYAHMPATSQSDIVRPARIATLTLQAIVHAAAKTLLGSAPVYSSSSTELARLAGLPKLTHPTLAVFKGSDMTPLATYQLENDSRETLAARLSSHKLPLAGQLTAATYPEYLGDRARSRLTVLAALSEAPQGSDVFERSKTVLSSIARSWVVEGGDAAAEANDVLWSGVSFAWVDAMLWAGWLKGNYALVVGSMPAVVIAEPKPGLYYDTDVAGNALRLDGPQLLGALEAISKGEIEPKSSRTATERAAHALAGRVHGVLVRCSYQSLLTIAVPNLKASHGLLVMAICAAVIGFLLKLAAEPLPRSSLRSVPKRD